VRILFGMGERIHRRLPMEFVKEVLAFPDSHRISEREAMGLLSHRKGLFAYGGGEQSLPFLVFCIRSIHLKRTIRKDGTIMFMEKK